MKNIGGTLVFRSPPFSPCVCTWCVWNVPLRWEIPYSKRTSFILREIIYSKGGTPCSKGKPLILKGNALLYREIPYSKGKPCFLE